MHLILTLLNYVLPFHIQNVNWFSTMGLQIIDCIPQGFKPTVEVELDLNVKKDTESTQLFLPHNTNNGRNAIYTPSSMHCLRGFEYVLIEQKFGI